MWKWSYLSHWLDLLSMFCLLCRGIAFWICCPVTTAQSLAQSSITSTRCSVHITRILDILVSSLYNWFTLVVNPLFSPLNNTCLPAPISATIAHVFRNVWLYLLVHGYFQQRPSFVLNYIKTWQGRGHQFNLIWDFYITGVCKLPIGFIDYDRLWFFF